MKMVKVLQPDPPAEFIEFLEKLVRWFDRYGVPIWAGNWYRFARSELERQKLRSNIQNASTTWNGLSTAQKESWRSAAYKAYQHYRSYRLFVADYNYRKGHGLSLPGSPSEFYQLFGLKLANPGGSLNVYAQRDEKDMVGPITIKVSFKKDEIAPSGTEKFIIATTAYYMSSGAISYDNDVYNCPAGNIAWNTLERSFGTAGRKYFHVLIRFTINNYNAEVYLDNFETSDQIGSFSAERWNTTDFKGWEPDMLYRKSGWTFGPSYTSPYITHQYIQ